MNKIENLHGSFYEIQVAGEAHAQYLPIKRDELISIFIRKRYTLDDEIATLANAEDSEKHAQEYAEYQAYRKAVKDGIAEIWDDVERINKEWEDNQPKPDMMRGEDNDKD